MTTTPEADARPASLDEIFRPRSVAVAGVSVNQPGFASVGLGFLLGVKEMGHPAVYPVNPKYDEIEGLRCYPSVRDIEGPVDHVVSSVPARVALQLVDDCVAKGVRSIQFFTAGFRETGEDDLTALETEIVARARAGGVRVFGPNCMGLYVPGAKVTFMSGFPSEPGNVGLLAQSGGNAVDAIYSSAVRGIRYSKAVSYGNAADVDESELLSYFADDAETEIIAAYIEGVKDGRRFLEAMRKAGAAKPLVVLKGGRTDSGTRAVMSHTASLAGSYEVFEALCRQTGAVLVKSVDEMVDLLVAFRFLQMPEGWDSHPQPSVAAGRGPGPPGVAVIGGGGGFSVFAADQVDEAGLTCPELPAETQEKLREFTPVAGTSVRNPVDTILLFEPGTLERAMTALGEAENIDVIVYHTSAAWGPSRRTTVMSGGQEARALMESSVRQMTAAREATGTPIALVLRPPLDVEGMERTLEYQEMLWRAGFPVYQSLPRAANAVAKALRWRLARDIAP
jgi:acyl-CoA synthetase (NDP forming)